MKFKLLSIFLLFGLSMFMFTSCEKENLDDTTTEEEETPVVVVECEMEVTIAEQPPGSGQLYSTVLGGTSPFLFQWSHFDSSATTIVTESGTYSLTVTDSEGCTAEGEITVELDVLCDDLAVSIDENPDGTLTANPTGGTAPYTYFWSTTDSSETILIFASGVYSVNVMDANGCSVQSEITVTLDNLCDDFFADIDFSANGLVAYGTGGTPPYGYLWSSGDTNYQVQMVLDTIYYVTITDSNGCTATDELLVNPCEFFSVTIENPQANTLISSYIGGQAPYTYSWSTGETTSSITAPGSGTYSLTMTDSFNCITEDEIEI